MYMHVAPFHIVVSNGWIYLFFSYEYRVKYSEILEKNKLSLVKGLGDVDDVHRITDQLVSERGLRSRAKQAIQAETKQGEKVLVLVDHLQENLTPASFESFLQCLECKGYSVLAEHIRNA